CGSGSTSYRGTVDGQDVKIYQYPRRHHTHKIKEKLATADVIKCALDTDAKFIDCAIEHKVDGIVIEAMGRGHANNKVAEGVKRAVDQGITVVITTDSDDGDLKHAYDISGGISQFEKDGAIHRGSYDSKKARIKLAVMLGAGKKVTAEDFWY